MKFLFYIFLLLFYSSTSHAGSNYKRDRIRIVGSSTLYPFITIIAERFSKYTNLKAPIIESNGTGGGVNLFCSKNGINNPDLVAASRKIKPSEISKCFNNKIVNIQEFLLGYDAIILINNIDNKITELSSKELFLALSEFIPKSGKLIQNPYHKWSQINPKLPDDKIEIYGPSFSSGTRDLLAELILLKECHNFPEFKQIYKNESDYHAACKLVRRDGHYIDMGENDNVIIHKVTSNHRALGLVGYNFYTENKHKISSISINNTSPIYENIISKKYLLSRELFLYLNVEHIKYVKGLNEFIKEISAEHTIGKYGYLTLKGFVSPIKSKLNN